MGHDDVLHRAAELAGSWLRSLPERPVGVPVEPQALRDRLDPTLPDDGADPVAVLDRLVAALEPGLVATSGPRYFGFVTGGTLPAALATDWLVSAFDQNPAVAVLSPAVAAVEQVAAAWVLELLGLPAGASVGFVTGGQMANFSCLAAARHALLAGEGWDVEADGLAGAPVPTVLVGDHVHATAVQALRLLGFGARRARRVPADDQGRMRPDALAAALVEVEGPVLVCAQAGEVNTGAVDPLDAIADVVSARERAWLHVDGAFGLWAAASPGRRPLLAGVERADSWAVDAHKWLNVPYDCGLAIVRDPAAAVAALSVTASYLAVGGRDPSALTPESSRRARALPVYAALRALGRHGVAELVDRCCALARQAADELARCPQVRVLNDVVLNQVLFRVEDADTAAVVDHVQRDGTCWVGGTTWHGRPAVRLSVSNWSTTPGDISRSVAAVTDAIAAVSRAG
ncbi:pyridoxal-dependent decarboxylase [Actinomycetospora sp. TBRC 11914]|uniref:pyridoxal phosphate-dependent decarboxylase family protein n=1 Tax=Actinomycetospora sp. TBRC 11914 TaxID=2729387 RepID=UPI00145F767D|nr:pyridoxal-dependent decarboxylase [Actinomycetospora sp. TBRC 11914]NMO93551.1 aspartate aminotransferase family protein [Actinomycetospora sp. TBRC 11914]